MFTVNEKGLAWRKKGGLQSSRGGFPEEVGFKDGENLEESRERLGYYERTLEASVSVGQDGEKTSLGGVETSTGEQGARGVKGKKGGTQSWREWWVEEWPFVGVQV